jgi:hypothetical protein
LLLRVFLVGGSHLHVLHLLRLLHQEFLRVGVGKGALDSVWGSGGFGGVLTLPFQLAQLFFGLAGEVFVLDETGLCVTVVGREGVAFE